MIKCIEGTKETRRNIKVAKLPVIELAIRLSTFYEYADDIREIIVEAMDDGYQNDEGLVITYCEAENIFIVISSNPEFDYLSEMYVPDEYPGIIDKILIGITIASLIINSVFSMLVVWVDNFTIGAWYILWALAQLWLFIFIMINLDIIIKRTKRRKSKSHKNISNINMR